MSRSGEGRLPFTNDDKLVGIVSLRDIVQFLSRTFDRERVRGATGKP